MLKRSDAYRYNLARDGADLTPLAACEAFIGPLKLRVHNISQGGIALLFDGEAPLKVGEVLSASVAIRERPFPVEIEVKGVRGHRVSCSFCNIPPNFASALQEYLQPKFLGDSLSLDATQSGDPEALSMVSEAKTYEVYLGQNQIGFFIWLDSERLCLKLVASHREMVMEWTTTDGLRTGRLVVGNDDVAWDKDAEESLSHYFADILMAWRSGETGARFVESILKPDSRTPVRFPVIL
jgi:hypothetical protein